MIMATKTLFPNKVTVPGSGGYDSAEFRELGKALRCPERCIVGGS